ncbi:MAG: phytanoyl-CoA dioxygenase family protein [Planctomycetota bacterium]|jgi:hypothetical protein|nr:phytanoyl-CoA dioxygenase family protein [Planctomycetota bacterium]
MSYSTTSSIDKDRPSYPPDQIAEIVEQFHREGYYCFWQVLSEDEIAALKNGMDDVYDNEELHGDEEGDYIRGISLLRMFEQNINFRDLIIREPFISVVEAILGADCHLMSQNALRNGAGEGVTGWHVDDRLLFPLPDGVERHDPRIRVPCFVINLLIPLTDVDGLEFGPTQVVPGSHYSGGNPGRQEDLSFEGGGPVSLTGKAGLAYMFHNQVWHRGHPNSSDRVRYVGGITYSQRVVSQRFYPFLNYRMPDYVLDGANDRMLRLLGKHKKAAYG